jgi:hypothetical protein
MLNFMETYKLDDESNLIRALNVSKEIQIMEMCTCVTELLPIFHGFYWKKHSF